MKYITKYSSPLGNIILTSDGEYLTSVNFEEYSKLQQNKFTVDNNLKIFKVTKKWLDEYFTGHNPNFTPKYKVNNVTPFRQEVIDEMIKIPFGKIVTYSDIAKNIANKRNIKKMSAQAVGGAVGSNPICIIIPCHRVMGSNGNLTGYGGGLKNKLGLLNTEKVDISNYKIPKKSKYL